MDALARRSGEIINIGTGIQSNIGQVVHTVFDLLKTEVPCNWNANARSWDTNVWVADCSKAKTLLGWAAKVSLEAGLAKTIDWMKK